MANGFVVLTKRSGQLHLPSARVARRDGEFMHFYRVWNETLFSEASERVGLFRSRQTFRRENVVKREEWLLTVRCSDVLEMRPAQGIEAATADETHSGLAEGEVAESDAPKGEGQ